MNKYIKVLQDVIGPVSEEVLIKVNDRETVYELYEMKLLISRVGGNPNTGYYNYCYLTDLGRKMLDGNR